MEGGQCVTEEVASVLPARKQLEDPRPQPQVGACSPRLLVPSFQRCGFNPCISSLLGFHKGGWDGTPVCPCPQSPRTRRGQTARQPAAPLLHPLLGSAPLEPLRGHTLFMLLPREPSLPSCPGPGHCPMGP